MDNYEKLYLVRLQQWKERLQKSLFTQTKAFNAKVSIHTQVLPFAERNKQHYRNIYVGETWGKSLNKKWCKAWFHVTATPDKEWVRLPLLARIDIGGEGLVFDNKGNPLQAITNSSVFDPLGFKRQFVHLAPYKTNNNFELWIEATASGLFGIDKPNDPPLDANDLHGYYAPKVQYMEYTVFDEKLWNFIYDVDVLIGLLNAVDEKSVRWARLMEGLMNVSSVYADRRENLGKAKSISDTLLRSKAVPSALTAFSVGHAHIDTAWLWPVAETRRKCARTFSSQIDLLERYPDYIFGASAAQHYLYIKEDHPELYKKIQHYVKKGRWELQGGMWIEADCNIPSGESLIRQFLHGKNFFMDEFGIDVDNLWIPDVFGYSASLPQIMHKSGVNFFLTQKLSWSQFNTFPHHTFMWKGIDGSQTLAHFPPEDTYNGILAPDNRAGVKGLVHAQDAFVEKAVLDDFIVLFGVGDGGGGPTDEMIERGIRMMNLEGVPKVRFGMAKELFSLIEHRIPKLKTWTGELYLEYHRGTFTTQAKVKYYNRKLEFALQTLEKLANVCEVSLYPATELDNLWKKLLLNQFHDILPGSSINEVYKVAHKEYEAMEQDIKHINKKLLSSITKKNSNAVLVFHPHSYEGTSLCTLPKQWDGYCVIDETGQELECQGNIVRLDLKQHQFKTLYKGSRIQRKADKIRTIKKRNLFVLENNLVKYEFDEKGTLTSIYDKEYGKNVSAGLGNVFTLYEDRPHTYDAWDIDEYYENCVQQILEAKQVSTEYVGSVYASIGFEYDFGASFLKQQIILPYHSKRLDFITKVDWKERHSMLRVHFPVNVHSTEASFDIQYGYLQRPTYRNTTWDRARFEVCAHKYADLSDKEYGVALLNDCKYGYKILDNTIDLCLLRSPTNPDPLADRGRHHFVYALLPHGGHLIDSDVMQQATDLNQPPLVFEGLELSSDVELPCIDSNNSDIADSISMDVIKRGEKDSSIYIRLVERKGKHSSCRIQYSKASQYIECDMMEWHALSRTNSINKELSFTPFEIKTIKLI